MLALVEHVYAGMEVCVLTQSYETKWLCNVSMTQDKVYLTIL